MTRSRTTGLALEGGGLLLSIGIHVLFLYGIVLTFTPRAVAHKPSITFLGAILENQDFYDLVTAIKDKGGPTGSDLFPVNVAATHSQFYPLHTTHVPKPVFSKQIKESPKENIKSNFLEAAQPDARPELSAKDLGVNPQAPPRIPLRLSWP